MSYRTRVLLLLTFALLCVVLTPGGRTAEADLAQVYRVSGPAQAVKWFAADLDQALDGIATAHRVPSPLPTKVVPLMDGQGAVIGGAQVSGTEENLTKAAAVLLTPVGDMERFTVVSADDPQMAVPDVGVTGLINF